MSEVGASGRDTEHAAERDALEHLARALAQVSAQPGRLPQPTADRVHELPLDLDAAGAAPPAPLDPGTDEPSVRLALEAGSRAPIVGPETVARCRDHWTWHGPVPVDERAEATLAGIALVSQTAARRVYQSVPAGAWSDSSVAGVVRVATEVGDDRRETSGDRTLRIVTVHEAIDVTDIEGCATRVTRIAQATGERRSRLVALVAGRAQHHDSDGIFAARVIAAAQARDTIAGHIDALEQHGLQVAIEPTDGAARPVASPASSEVRERLAAYARTIDTSSDTTPSSSIAGPAVVPEAGRSR